MPYLRKDANWVCISAFSMGSTLTCILCNEEILDVQALPYFVVLGMIGGFCSIGALVAGFYLERIKHTIKITNAMLLAGLFLGVWPNKYCLLASNALQTTSAGIFSVVVPRYLLYQQPLYRRHKASVWVMLAILLGVAAMSLYCCSC